MPSYHFFPLLPMDRERSLPTGSLVPPSVVVTLKIAQCHGNVQGHLRQGTDVHAYILSSSTDGLPDPNALFGDYGFLRGEPPPLTDIDDFGDAMLHDGGLQCPSASFGRHGVRKGPPRHMAAAR